MQHPHLNEIKKRVFEIESNECVIEKLECVNSFRKNKVQLNALVMNGTSIFKLIIFWVFLYFPRISFFYNKIQRLIAEKNDKFYQNVRNEDFYFCSCNIDIVLYKINTWFIIRYIKQIIYFIL